MAKAEKIKVQNFPLLNEGQFVVEKVNDLNFFDLTGNKAKTKGSSNKMYHSELQVAKDNSSAQIFTMFGPTGQVQRKDWRHFTDIERARKEYEKILSGKRKKGYKDIDIAQRAIGSDDAKKIIKPVVLKNVPVQESSKLHTETERLISVIMGATNKFVAETLRCPLGQLSNEQIDNGRACLNKAKTIINKKTITNKDNDKIEELTNEFYSLIPHNLGSGSRGQMSHLLLDDISKINQKEYDLDTLLDAKSIGNSLISDSIYDQYKSLDTDLDYIDSSSSLFGWLSDMVLNTRAKNHNYLRTIKVLNAWKVNRAGENSVFENRMNQIAKEVKTRQPLPVGYRDLMVRRPENRRVFSQANVLPLFHGTRTQNISGIFKKGLLIRPSGVVITGAMYGNSLYMAKNSTKSINYTSINTSYWAKGNDNKAFLFLADCVLGNQLIANGPYQYSKQNISPHHSVWAKPNRSGIINDEFMLYDTNQHNIKYVLEFTCT